MKKTHQVSKTLYTTGSKLTSKRVRQAFRSLSRESYTSIDLVSLRSIRHKNVKLYHLSPYINSQSRRHCVRNLLSHSDTNFSVMAFRSRAGRGHYILMPSLYRGDLMSNKRRRSIRFFTTLSRKVRLQSPSNNLRSFVRTSLSLYKSIDYSPRSTLSYAEWQNVLLREKQSMRDLRLTRRLKRHNRARKLPSSHTVNLANLPLITKIPGILSSPTTSKKVFLNSACISSAISKDYVISYIERSYVGIKDSLSRLINSWVSQYKVVHSGSNGFLTSYTSVPNVSHVLYPSWLAAWTLLTSLYSSFTLFPQTDLYYKIHSAERKVIEHILRFRFNKSRLHIILEDSKVHQTHFFTTPGLFIRYFQGKKSLKKSKALKYLMARFLRKMLLVLNLESVGVITKGVPVHLDQLLTAIFKPLSHPFTNPLTGETINESDSTTRHKPKRGNVGISSITFLAPKPFSYQKTRKRGRIKRKIQRKLVRLNKVID